MKHYKYAVTAIIIWISAYTIFFHLEFAYSNASMYPPRQEEVLQTLHTFAEEIEADETKAFCNMVDDKVILGRSAGNGDNMLCYQKETIPDDLTFEVKDGTPMKASDFFYLTQHSEWTIHESDAHLPIVDTSMGDYINELLLILKENQMPSDEMVSVLRLEDGFLLTDIKRGDTAGGEDGYCGKIIVFTRQQKSYLLYAMLEIK